MTLSLPLPEESMGRRSVSAAAWGAAPPAELRSTSRSTVKDKQVQKKKVHLDFFFFHSTQSEAGPASSSVSSQPIGRKTGNTMVFATYFRPGEKHGFITKYHTV